MKRQSEKTEQHFGEKHLTVSLLANESCTTKLVTHPLYTLLDLHVPPSPLTPLLTHFCVSTEAGMSSPFFPPQSPPPPWFSLLLGRRGLPLMEWLWRDSRLALNITLLSHRVASS